MVIHELDDLGVFSWLVTSEPSIYIYNAKSGLINTPLLINLLLQKKCNLKTGGPPGWMNRLARKWLINPLCWNQFFIQQILFPILFISNCFLHFFFLSSLLYLRFKLIIENFKNNYSPNHRFLIKFFIKIISLDSSQRVPSMSKILWFRDRLLRGA